MKTLIGPKTAAALFAVLIAIMLWKLHGKALALSLFVILAIAGKAYVAHLRRRLE